MTACLILIGDIVLMFRDGNETSVPDLPVDEAHESHPSEVLGRTTFSSGILSLPVSQRKNESSWDLSTLESLPGSSGPLHNAGASLFGRGDLGS